MGMHTSGPAKNAPPFLQGSICLSRACLDKSIFVIGNGAKKNVDRTPSTRGHRAVRPRLNGVDRSCADRHAAHISPFLRDIAAREAEPFRTVASVRCPKRGGRAVGGTELN
jgi:hypothetical protein